MDIIRISERSASWSRHFGKGLFTRAVFFLSKEAARKLFETPPARKFVVFSQNHDQIGNRMSGERLSTLVPFEALKLAAGVILLSANIPLLFMGEEYGEEAPFRYFVSHSDETDRGGEKGGREEFAGFRWEGEIPDPQDEANFLAPKSISI